MAIWDDAIDMAGDAWGATGGKVVDGLFSSDPNKAWDKSNFNAQDFSKHEAYNPNAFSYGGQGQAHADFLANQQGDVSGQFRDRGNAAQGRRLDENGNLVATEAGARGQMQDAIGMQRSIAMGNGPSQAPAVLQQGVNQAHAAGTSMAGGARGQAALALGQSNAQANTANAIQHAGGDAARIKAQEQLQGAGMYGSLSRDQRGMDQSRIGQSNQMSMFNRQSNDQYDIQNQNLAFQRDQLAHQMRTQQQMGGAQQQQMLANSSGQAQGINHQTNMYNTNAVAQRKNMIGGMLGGVVGMATGGGGGGAGMLGSMTGGGGGGGAPAGGGGVSKWDPGY